MHELISHELETAIKIMVQAHSYQLLNDSNRPEAPELQLLKADKVFRSKKNAACGVRTIGTLFGHSLVETSIIRTDGHVDSGP